MASGAHDWTPIKRLTWVYCAKCGLVRLRNPRSDAAARDRCRGAEHEDR